MIGVAKKRKKGGDCPAGAAKRAQQAYRGADREHTDVLGSYTGLPEDGGVPVQDVDDL